MQEVPLYDQSGSIVAHAFVDDEDYESVSAYRWYRSSSGYATTSTPHPSGGSRRNGTQARRCLLGMHRLVLGLEFGNPLEPDHHNRNKLDNQKVNLRVGTHAMNLQHRPARPDSLSQLRGVTWDKRKGKWMARATLDGTTRFLGYYNEKDEAGRVAAQWRLENMPFTVEA